MQTIVLNGSTQTVFILLGYYMNEWGNDSLESELKHKVKSTLFS